MPIEKNKFLRRELIDRWNGMRYRCEKPHNPAYHHYGARGIRVCEEWQDFKNFYEWSIANGYSKELQIDRIDNDEGYSPENCRWVTARENSFNKSNSILVELDGEDFRFSDLSKETGISEGTLRARYKRGDRGEYLIRPKGNYSRDYSINPSNKETKLVGARIWLKEIRLEAGLKQEEVAEKSGVSRALYGHIETGERDLSPKNAKVIAKTLDFDWKRFFEEPRHDLKNQEREKVLSKA